MSVVAKKKSLNVSAVSLFLLVQFVSGDISTITKVKVNVKPLTCMYRC